MVDYLSKEEIELVKNELKKTVNSKRNIMLFMVAVNSGLRSSDLINLTLDKLKNYSLTMKKTGKQVRLIIPAELMEMVETYCKDNNILHNEPLFTTFVKRGGKLRASRKPITYSAFKMLLNKIGKELNLTLGTHSLRKTFGRFLYNHTKDINIVAEFLGHTNSSSTIKYIGLTDDLLQNVRKEIGLIG